MTKKASTKKENKKEEKPAKEGLSFGRKKTGFRTSKQFRRKIFRRNPALTTQRPRSLGGHQ